MKDRVVPSYVRRQREGPLSFRTKLFQGIGAIPDTVKNWTFNSFVLLFYNQILGVDPTLVSIALAVATVFDGVTGSLTSSFFAFSANVAGSEAPSSTIGWS